MRLESLDINGGKILLFGDLHLSAKFNGKHLSYIQECYYNLERIMEVVKKEKPSAVVFLGDLVGVSEKNLTDRQFLMRVLMFFNLLNKVTNGHVYSVKGNHDMGDFSDFDLLVGLGYIKNPSYLNYYSTDEDGNTHLEMRLHLVNYGDEHKPLKLAGSETTASDIVLGHCDYYIDGVTNWYAAESDVRLPKLKNFCGVQMVFSGHVHTPSDEVLYAAMEDGSSVGLFFPGSLGRVAERYNDCWYVVLDYIRQEGSEEYSSIYDVRYFGLQPANEVFYPDKSFIGEGGSEDSEEAERKKKSDTLTDIVKEIMEGRITSGNLFHQIDIIPGADKEAKELAKSYLEKASKGK